MRRELLVLGKFIAGAITAIFFFGLGVLASFTLMYAHFGPAGRAFVFDGPGLGHAVAYLGVTALACLGYGSIFLALSLLLRNPMITAAIVLIWETFHAVLPSVLQKFSVTFYLKYLCPVSIPPEGVMALFTVVSDPVSPWIAVPGKSASSRSATSRSRFLGRRWAKLQLRAYPYSLSCVIPRSRI